MLIPTFSRPAPTHNLTLTRTATELVELDLKLRHSHRDASIKIPTLPINPDTLPTPPPKRKSTFLNTLSRLASPTGGKALKSEKGGRRSNNLSSAAPSLATPSPVGEIGDPFSSLSMSSDAGGDASFGSGSGLVESPLGASISGSTDLNGTSTTGSKSGTAASATPTSPTTSATSTALASYLTTISNIASLRADRVWKRFVRVRTDDLESVRVERAIKRVRSDLAAHSSGAAGLGSVREKENASVKDFAGVIGGGSFKEKENVDKASSKNVPSVHDGGLESSEEQTKEEVVAEEGKLDDSENNAEAKEDGHPSKANNATESTMTPEDASIVDDTSSVQAADVSTTAVGVEAETEAEASSPSVDVPPTPLGSDISASRIPRSQSAEPDKSHRVSRAYTSSVPSQSGAESQTGDESSSSVVLTSGGSEKRSRRRKKRSSSRLAKDSSIPSTKEPKKSHRKVVIDDFEMMRVLGKGCAGKVLLVRHKQTQDLFALKAITKRHVLAHQELQHTLTEQAVLKRMAAESRDPFVVKLWWSFHDRENLFLVMVCFIFPVQPGWYSEIAS